MAKMVLIDSAPELRFSSFDLAKRKNNKCFQPSQKRFSTSGKKSVFRVRLKVARILGFPKDAIPLDPDYAWILPVLAVGKRKGSDPGECKRHPTASTTPTPLSSRLCAPLAFALPRIKFETVHLSFEVMMLTLRYPMLIL